MTHFTHTTSLLTVSWASQLTNREHSQSIGQQLHPFCSHIYCEHFMDDSTDALNTILILYSLQPGPKPNTRLPAVFRNPKSGFRLPANLVFRVWIWHINFKLFYHYSLTVTYRMCKGRCWTVSGRLLVIMGNGKVIHDYIWQQPFPGQLNMQHINITKDGTAASCHQRPVFWLCMLN